MYIFVFAIIFAILAIIALLFKSFGVFVFSAICCIVCVLVWQKRRDLKSNPPGPGATQIPHERTLEENAGCPYSAEIKQKTHFGTPLSYSYNDVACTITGDVYGIRTGSVVFTNYDGEIENAIHQAIAKLDSDKLSKMVDDYLKRGDTISARVSSVCDKLYINIGFYREPDEETDDEDDLDDIDDKTEGNDDY